jgi:hypothetical protein
MVSQQVMLTSVTEEIFQKLTTFNNPTGFGNETTSIRLIGIKLSFVLQELGHEYLQTKLPRSVHHVTKLCINVSPDID